MKKTYKSIYQSVLIILLCIVIGISSPIMARADEFTPVIGTAALLTDADSGNVLYDQNSHGIVAPASTTKILTALLVIEAIERGQLGLDTVVTVSQSCLSSLPSSASHVTPKLKAGEELNILELLLAMMIQSDCNASNLLAETVSGSVPAFAELMNQRSRELGITDSNWVEPSGYPASNHYTSAYSLSVITREALKHNTFRMLISCPGAVLPATNKCSARSLTNTNKLMCQGMYYNPYCIGGKTGSSKSSGECIVAVGQKDGKTVIAVVMGSNQIPFPTGGYLETRFYEANRLLQKGLGY